jgi:putative phosphoesterase
LKRIGILSDTHSYLDKAIFRHFEECDEIWHAGDIGSIDLYDELLAFKPVRAVYGNIDNHKIRSCCRETARFNCEQVDVLIKHIVGYPNRYDRTVVPTLQADPPKLLVAGHSHICKVIYDEKYKLLFINPGAAGKSGFHKVQTLVRLTIDNTNMKDLEVIELKR